MDFSEDNGDDSIDHHAEDILLMKELVALLFIHLKKESAEEESEPFETYIYHLKMRLHGNVNVFQNRFIQGYEVLLQTLANEPKN